MVTYLEWIRKQFILADIFSKTKLEGIKKKLNFYYAIKEFYENRTKDKRLFILLGLRGIGKTTAMAQFYQYLKSRGITPLFFSADTQDFFDLNLVDVVKTYRELTEPPFVVIIDEAHKKENWHTELKNAFDIFNDVFFLVSGSSSLKLQSSVLKRRALFYEASPLSFKEYCRLKNLNVEANILDVLISKNPFFKLIKEEPKIDPKVKRLLASYIKFGSFPISLNIKEPLVYEFIFDICSKVVEEDLLYLDSFKSSTIKDAMKVLFYLASSSTAEISIRKLSREFGLSKTAISSLISSLCDAGLLVEVKSFKASLRKQPKLYFRTPALRVSLLKHLGLEADIGILREEAVLSALKNAGLDVYFLKNKIDVDFVVKYKGKKLLLEVGGPGKKPKNKNFIIIADIDEPLYKQNLIIPLWIFLLI